MKPALYVLAGALAAVFITPTSALAGSGVGGVFNLGQVDAATTLSGNSASGPQLTVKNTNTSTHTLLAQAGGGGGIALYGQHTTTGGPGPALRAAAGTFGLHTEIPWSGGDAPCPAGLYASPTVGCHPHPGGPVAVPGLGFVTQSYLYAVETAPGPACPDGFYVLGYAARLKVEGKGEVYLSLGPVSGCLFGPPTETVLSPTQSFVVTGGSGRYAGGSGAGVVSRTNVGRTSEGHGQGTDVWDGTLNVPGLEFDLTAPTILGAGDKVVRVHKYKTVRITRRKTKRVLVKRVRVSYSVTAIDGVDAQVKSACKPASRSFFKVGRATAVNCSATDTSANKATAAFTVTVKPT
jgi:hypothetical protein